MAASRDCDHARAIYTGGATARLAGPSLARLSASCDHARAIYTGAIPGAAEAIRRQARAIPGAAEATGDTSRARAIPGAAEATGDTSRAVVEHGASANDARGATAGVLLLARRGRSNAHYIGACAKSQVSLGCILQVRRTRGRGAGHNPRDQGGCHVNPPPSKHDLGQLRLPLADRANLGPSWTNLVPLLDPPVPTYHEPTLAKWGPRVQVEAQSDAITLLFTKRAGTRIWIEPIFVIDPAAGQPLWS